MVTTERMKIARSIQVKIRCRLLETGMERKWLATHLGWKRQHLDYLLRNPERITAVDLYQIMEALGTTITLGKE